MLKAIIDYINLQLCSVGIFETVAGLCDMIGDSESHYPAKYTGNGQYDSLNNNLTSYNGLCYIRRNGPATDSAGDDTVTSNTTRLFSFPLTIVCIVPKKNLKDDAYSDNELANIVTKVLSGVSRPVRIAINANKVDIDVTSQETDNQAILSKEYKGAKFVDVPYSLSYLSIDFNATVDINNACIDSCDVDDIINGFKWCRESTYLGLTPENLACIQDYVCNTGGAGSVNNNQSDGTFLQNVVGATPPTENNIADSTISSTLGTFTDSVKATDPYVIADVNYTDSSGVPQTEEYGTTINCAVSLGIIYNPAVPTGQYTIQQNGDDAWRARNEPQYAPSAGVLARLTPATSAYPVILEDNNVFGNKDRFVNDMGGLATDGSDGSTANYIIDTLTRYGWYLPLQGPSNWSNAVSDSQSLVVGPYSDFFLATASEGETLSNPELTAVFNYPPFNITTSIWTSTTPKISTGRAYQLASNGDIAFPTKTTSISYLAVRMHFT